VPPAPDSPPELLELTGQPLLARLLVQRGLTTAAQARAFLDPEAYRPAPPAELPDLAIAVERLTRAIEQQELICVWGDFDVDGQTATTLLVSTLQALGARVRYYIPNRLTESHGLNLPALERQLSAGVELFLTCDTGIEAHQAVAAAQAAGATVIITDHHDLPDTLPPAAAAVNPKRLPAGHPLGELPGVGVAYELAEALLQQSHPQPAAASESLLDLVALGIVADLACQRGDTRYLLQRGLAVLQRPKRLGLQALLESANLKPARLTEEHIGFWLAPRLNALGRLGDANLAVDLLTTDELARARIIALQLEALNDRRKLLVDRVVVQALGQLEDTPSLADYKALVLAAADWHPGVLGLAASRLSDQFGKPAILLALRPDGLARGSARSVPGCDIHQALKTQAGRLANFGGHPMAAGLSLPPENIAPFRQGLSAALADCRPDPTLTLDAWLELAEISPELLATIQRLAPFGAGNPRVKLGCSGLQVMDEVVFGKTGRHKRVVVRDEAGRSREVIWWGGAGERTPQGRFDLAFTLSPNEFRGGEAVQVTWLKAREWTSPAVVPAMEFIDWRGTSHPLDRVRDLYAKNQNLVVWAEGLALPNLPLLARHRVQPAEALVIWTAPPGQDVFRQVLAGVRPRQILVVGQAGPFDTLPAFIRQLMGLVKYAGAQKAGEVELEALAAALGQRVTTARLGLDWLAAQGKLTFTAEEDDLLVVRPANQPPSPDLATIEALLQEALAETAAYRRFFKQASLESIERMAG
jgi:single-stranded-DNA-specific exonuclease